MGNWTEWKDISVFNFAGQSYLLQGRRNVRTNRKKFCITTIGSRGVIDNSCTEEELLTVGLFLKE